MKMLKPGKPLKLQPPIIPVIDVVFNLIIFFMLTPSVSGSDGFLSTNLPKNSGPNAGKGATVTQNIRIKIYDVGPDGQYNQDGRNDYADIQIEGQDLGGNFEALHAWLQNKRDQGLSPTTAILINPTMACMHKYVVQTFDAAVLAGFTDIQFAVPYDN
jgi:biopolymer transport protein ExbD